jgi:tetratricopeptide (TPR) repeat protein
METERADEAASVCEEFQLELSCLVDGELDEMHAARALAHLEGCAACSDFFDDTRRSLRLHRDIAQPERLLARVATLTGADMASEASRIDLVHRLATIFYQLGKAYVLAALEPDYWTRVFEDAVPIAEAQTRGRGFVDGVILSGQAGEGEADWTGARRWLNGRLQEIENPLEKGRKLLEEAIAADPSHEEARLYLAYVHAREGKRLQASREFADIFETAVRTENRGHAAVQLGKLFEDEGDWRRALVHFRWVTISGLDRIEPKFFFASFNIGLQYARLRDRRRALAYFRRLIDLHPGHIADTVTLFASSDHLRDAIEPQRGFAEALVATCPELFQPVQDPQQANRSDSQEG